MADGGTEEMHIENLKLANFKSYQDQELDFCGNVNCLVGNNGVGKTNLLDAVYYLSFCKSFFNPQDVQNIRHGEEFFAVHGRYQGIAGQEDSQISCVVKKGHGKQMKCNGKTYKTFSEHIGKIPLVMISPVDQIIIMGGSEVRRKFMDGVLSQTDKEYLNNLLQYQKALEQRNKLLKQMSDDRYLDETMLDLWDEQLVRYGEPIFERRKVFLSEFGPIFNDYYNSIATEKEAATIVYQSQLAESEESFNEALKKNHHRDLYAQYTTVGIHKDDLDLNLGEYAVKKYGSQGQQKTFVLALKLAQFQYIYNMCGQKPILLLDDIFDKLDMVRVKQLIQLVGSDRFGQVLLTDTQPGRVEQIFEEIGAVEHKIYEVEEGGCREI